MNSNPHLYHRLLDRPARRRSMVALLLTTAIAASGCTSVPIKESGALTSYSKLGPAKGKLGKKRIFVEGQELVR